MTALSEQTTDNGRMEDDLQDKVNNEDSIDETPANETQRETPMETSDPNPLEEIFESSRTIDGDDIVAAKSDDSEVDYDNIRELNVRIRKDDLKHLELFKMVRFVSKFRCNLCAQRFDSKEKFKQHFLGTHAINRQDKLRVEPTRIKKYKCTTCSELFDTVDQVKRHNYIRHAKATEKDEVFHCQYCLQSFNASWRLQHHYKLDHSSEQSDDLSEFDRNLQDAEDKVNSAKALLDNAFSKTKGRTPVITEENCPEDAYRFRVKRAAYMRKYRDERRLAMQNSKLNLLLESKRQHNRLLLQRGIEQPGSDPLEPGEVLEEDLSNDQEILPADDELISCKEETL